MLIPVCAVFWFGSLLYRNLKSRRRPAHSRADWGRV